MGLLLQIIGVLITVVSLIFSIIAIINGTFSNISVALVIFGGILVRLGRKIYNNKRNP